MSELSLGGWLQTPSPDAAEIIARAGFDWVCVDMEHGAITLRDLPDLFRAIDLGGADPWVRLRCPAPDRDDTLVRRVVDAGASGIIVADVRDSTQIWHVARAVAYPPNGCRGFGYARCNGYGAEFEPAAARAPRIVAQIESRVGVRRIDQIVQVKGVDAAFVGPLDLSADCGHLGDLDHPAVRGMLETVVGACRTHEKAAGLHVVRPTLAAVKRAVEDGYDTLALGTDGVFLAEGARRALQAAREE